MVKHVISIQEIMRTVVERVALKMEARTEDAFTVYFDHGLFVDVEKAVYKDYVSFPLVWLVSSTIDIQKGRNYGSYGEATFDMMIVMPTDKDATIEDRLQTNFKHRLYPIYLELLNQISVEPYFCMPEAETIEHRQIDRPYWGGVEGGSDTANLFKKYVDAIQLKQMRLTVSDMIPDQFKIFHN